MVVNATLFCAGGVAGAGMFAGAMGMHYARNLFNKNYSKEELEAMGVEPVEDRYAKFHQNHQRSKNEVLQPNKKYVIGDWFSSEVVLYYDGEINDTPEDMGTPNLYSGDNWLLNIVIHGPFDVVPYMLWGNTPKDSTTIIDRFAMALK